MPECTRIPGLQSFAGAVRLIQRVAGYLVTGNDCNLQFSMIAMSSQMVS